MKLIYDACFKQGTYIGELVTLASSTELKAYIFSADIAEKRIGQAIALEARIKKAGEAPAVKTRAIRGFSGEETQVLLEEGFTVGTNLAGFTDSMFTGGVYSPAGSTAGDKDAFLTGEYIRSGKLKEWREHDIGTVKKPPKAAPLPFFTQEHFSQIYGLCSRAAEFSRTLATENMAGDRNHLYLWAMLGLGLTFEEAFDLAFLNAITADEEERQSILSEVKMNDRYKSLCPLRIKEFTPGWGPYDPSRVLDKREKECVPVLDKYVGTEQDDLIVSLIYQSRDTDFPLWTVLLQGDAGSGKTTLQRRIARDLCLPYAEFTCSAETDKYDGATRSLVKS